MNGKATATLNIIGCGKVGCVLANLWHHSGTFRIGGVLTRSLQGAQFAVDQIGAGEVLGSLDDLDSADFYMIAVPDQQIWEVAGLLADAGITRVGDIVFHVSGALGSRLLVEAGLDMATVASVHPLRSFADFASSKANFTGTWCGFEGDPAANPVLTNAIANIGGRLFTIQPEGKLIYHAASVMVSNYLNALIESGLKCYQLAGIDREVSMQLINPVVSNTCKDILENGPLPALTGPIARGDWGIVSSELSQLTSLDPELGEIYRSLARATLELAQSGNLLNKEQITKLKQALS